MLQIDKCDKAKQYSEKALAIAVSKGDKIIEGHCRSILGRVNEKIWAASLYVFVFLKAWPVIDLETNENIGPFTVASNTFK